MATIKTNELQARSKTSTSTYEIGMTVSYTGLDTSHAKCKATITPYLRRTSKDEKRFQHNWNVKIINDSTTYEYKNVLLPDSRASSVVGPQGWMTMKDDVWYQWGKSYDIDIDNDGKIHTIGIHLECPTLPRYCPGKDTNLTIPVKTPQYSITPSAPEERDPGFDIATRKLTYYWGDTTDCWYVKVKRKFTYTDGTTSKETHLTINGTDKFANKDMRADKINETLARNIVSVTYRIENYSKTETMVSSDWKTVPTLSDCKVLIKDGTVWKKAIPYVKTPTGWKKASKVYVRTADGSWKQTIM